MTEALLTFEAKDPNFRASWVKAAFTQTIYLAFLYLNCSFFVRKLEGAAMISKQRKDLVIIGKRKSKSSGRVMGLASEESIW